jgi:hypothetical protein
VGRRRAVQPATRILVLHECGYRCSNPTCRMVLTLDGGFWAPATVTKEERVAKYWMVLSAKGRAFVSAWKKGDQKTAVGALGSPRGA